jgi:hypothetical protein
MEQKEAFETMVKANLETARSWKLALILTNAFWAVALVIFMLFAFFVPVEMEQSQDFPAQQQEQRYGG